MFHMTSDQFEISDDQNWSPNRLVMIRLVTKATRPGIFFIFGDFRAFFGEFYFEFYLLINNQDDEQKLNIEHIDKS
jgi:hypothetical protein